jgi:hypothetical protein
MHLDAWMFVFVVSRDKKCKMQENQDSEKVGIKYKNRLQKIAHGVTGISY